MHTSTETLLITNISYFGSSKPGLDFTTSHVLHIKCWSKSIRYRYLHTLSRYLGKKKKRIRDGRIREDIDTIHRHLLR